MSMTLEEEADLKVRVSNLEKDLHLLVKNLLITQTSLIKLVEILKGWDRAEK